MVPVRLSCPSHIRFSEERALRAEQFFERHLHHTKGKFYGKPFRLPPWQREDIRQIFGRVDESGNRVVRQVYWEVPKKNGKSEIAAGVALKLLFADDEPGAEVYGAAADRDQASIVFDVAARMVRLDPALLRAAGGPRGIVDSRKRIVCPRQNSFYRVVSSEVGGKHGFNTSGCIFDEVHAQKDMRLWEVLTFGAGAVRTQPITFAITTAGIPGESPVAEMLHGEADQILRGIIPCPDSLYPVIYAAPSEADWKDPEVWRECNPAYGDFLSPEAVALEFDQAQRRPSEQNSFRRLRLNQWVAQETRAIDMADWDACSGTVDINELRRMPCWVGVDLSTKMDITAVVVVWLDGSGVFHWLPYFYIPADNLQDRPSTERDKYRVWEQQGLLNTTPGSSVDFDTIRRKINELDRDLNIQQVAYDPMFAAQLAQQLTADGFTCVEFRQNRRQYTEPYQSLERAIAGRMLRHGGHPILRWMADCLSVKQYPDGSVMLMKPERLKSTKRIDGMVAGVMATARAILAEDTSPVLEVRTLGVQ